MSCSGDTRRARSAPVPCGALRRRPRSSRLALEAARRLEGAYPQGVFFVPLAGTPAADFILPAIAEVAGCSCSGADNPKAQYLNRLRERAILLVLDNLEHLLEGIEILTEILQACPRLKILATSRHPLDLRTEWTVTVQGLPIPSNVRLETVDSHSAISLFLQRAHQVQFDFQLEEQDLPQLERICRLVEGLPLGVEIAPAGGRQALLSRGDRRVGRLLKSAHERGGDWKAASRDLGIDTAFYVTRRRAFDEVLSWDFIDIGVRKEYLKNEHARALEGRYTPPCKVGTCLDLRRVRVSRRSRR